MDKFVKSFDGTRVFYNHQKGRLPLTLVFLHGVGGNWTVWRKEINYFQRKGFSTLAIDLRGHGQSDAPQRFKRYKLPCFSRDLHLILAKEKLKNFSLIGHSLGGGIIINYCMRYPRLFPGSVIFVESASTYPFDHDRLLNMSPYVTQFLRFVSEHKVTQQHHFSHFKDIDLSSQGVEQSLNLVSHLMHLTPLRSIVKTLDNLEKFVFNNHQRIDETLRDLKIPILVIAGEKDQIVPPKFSRRIKEINKKAQLRILKGAHHRVIINHPRRISIVIADFLKRI